MIGIFLGTNWFLALTRSMPALAALPPSQPLGLIFMVLFFMLLLSNLVTALGSLFLSEDLDVILASPISTSTFFFGRFWYICLTSSWMPFLFILPLLVAFGISYDAPIEYYVAAAAILIPYFVLPTALGICFATVMSLLIPASRTRVARLFITGLFFVALYAFIDLIHRGLQTLNNGDELVRILRVMAMPTRLWLPSHWVANCFQTLLRPFGDNAIAELTLLYSTAIAATAAAYLLIDSFHFRAFSNARNNRYSVSIARQSFDARFHQLLFFVRRPFRALILKEFKTVTREITYLFEVFLITGLCVTYLYHLRVFAVLDTVPQESRGWWQNILFILNVAMDAFVATALCTRFVYPSISREGRAYWVTRTSPLSVRDIMRAKFMCWFIPVGIITCIFFALGGYALGAPTIHILLTTVLSWIICYSVVASGIGFGAYFAVFDWEHPSQLSAGFGSFVYMLHCTLLIFLNMIPAWILLFIPLNRIPVLGATTAGRWSIVLIFLLITLIANVIITRTILKAGQEQLEG